MSQHRGFAHPQHAVATRSKRPPWGLSDLRISRRSKGYAGLRAKGTGLRVEIQSQFLPLRCHPLFGTANKCGQMIHVGLPSASPRRHLVVLRNLLSWQSRLNLSTKHRKTMKQLGAFYNSAAILRPSVCKLAETTQRVEHPPKTPKYVWLG